AFQHLAPCGRGAEHTLGCVDLIDPRELASTDVTVLSVLASRVEGVCGMGRHDKLLTWLVAAIQEERLSQKHTDNSIGRRDRYEGRGRRARRGEPSPSASLEHSNARLAIRRWCRSTPSDHRNGITTLTVVPRPGVVSNWNSPFSWVARSRIM